MLSEILNPRIQGKITSALEPVWPTNDRGGGGDGEPGGDGGGGTGGRKPGSWAIRKTPRFGAWSPIIKSAPLGPPSPPPSPVAGASVAAAPRSDGAVVEGAVG